ncbi:MAG: rRNA maturation RNase YbeY [Candidatus Pacebacteria bacterium]|nr:rRNA maturation RNase YbeY [Candidatus Paceibacterota bacterium]
MFLETKNLIVNKKRGLVNETLFSFIKIIKKEILKDKYSLSINFIPPNEAKALNEKYRNKDYTPNVLSFPLSKEEGEIFICLSVARKGAKEFSLSYDNFVRLLIIHGCLHLQGMEHCDEMESKESKYFQKYMLK